MNQGDGGDFKKAVFTIHGPKWGRLLRSNVNFLIILGCSVSCCASHKRGTTVPLETKAGAITEYLSTIVFSKRNFQTEMKSVIVSKQRQQERVDHQSAYLTMKNNSFARFAGLKCHQGLKLGLMQK